MDDHLEAIFVEAARTGSGNLHDVGRGGVDGRSGVERLSSTVDCIGEGNLIFVPLEDEVIIVVIIEVSSQGNIATFADVSLSRGNIYVRFSFNPEFERFAHGTATIASGNLNLNEVRTIIRVVVLAEVSAVTITELHVVAELAVNIPSVGERSDVDRRGINIGECEDRVGLADIRITSNLDSRVHINIESVGAGLQGGTARRNLMSNCGIYIVGIVIINSQLVEVVGEGTSGDVRDELAISVPSVVVRELNRINTTMSMSSDGRLATVAHLVEAQGNAVNNRNLVDVDHDAVIVDAFRTHLVNLYVVGRGGIRRYGHDALHITIQRVGKAISVPSVHKIGEVVVVDVSRQNRATTLADVEFASGDFNSRHRVDNQSVNVAGADATEVVSHDNGEVVAVVSRFEESIELRHGNTISDGVVVELPSEVQVSSRIIIRYVSIQMYRVELTDERVAGDDHVRIRVHSQDVRSSAVGSTTRDILIDNCGVYIFGNVIVNGERADREGSASFTNNEFTISVPSVDVRNVSRIHTTVSVSGNGHLTTVADFVIAQDDAVDNRSLVHLDGDGVV